LPLAASAHASALAGARIAIVDDEKMVVEGMRALFATWGAQVIGAESADALLGALAESATCPDLLIADYRLKRNELGTDAIARLREELGPWLPALLISGDSSSATLSMLRQSGVEFLLKPVRPDELKTVSVRLVAASRRNQSIGTRAVHPMH
jgi:DNA-binding NtrC family response regulator